MKKVRPSVRAEGRNLLIPWGGICDKTFPVGDSRQAEWVVAWLSKHPRRKLRWDSNRGIAAIYEEDGTHTTVESLLSREYCNDTTISRRGERVECLQYKNGIYA